jgi:sphingomyelin phosphodiesterase
MICLLFCFRVYTIDGDHDTTTRMVLDHENWFMDLKEANLYNKPRWRKLYSALQAYSMKGASPKDWDTLVHKLTYNDNLFQTYYKFYWRNSPVRPQCDEECKKRLLCDLVSGRSHDRKQTCVVIEQRMDEQTGGWKTWLVNGLTITWVSN